MPWRRALRLAQYPQGNAHRASTCTVGPAATACPVARWPARSTLIIEPGRRHVCHYDSGYGVLSLGVAADEILNGLTEQGGEVEFSYTLDTGSTQISYNKVKITVQEAE